MTEMPHVTQARPLAGIRIGISISEAETAMLRARGLTPADVNDVTVELCRRLVSLGAQVVLGHQWRPGGVMEAVARFAQVYQPESKDPIIHNFLAYPDRAALSDHDRQRLGPVVAIHDEEDRESLPRPAALRRMRELMADVVDARIALCGKLTQPEGFVPGLIEEVVLTLARNRPVYVSAMMGGTSEIVTRYLRGDGLAFDSATARFDSSVVRWRESVEFKSQIAQLSAFDLSRLSNLCGLEPRELEELFDAQNVDTVLHLATKGLARRFRRR